MQAETEYRQNPFASRGHSADGQFRGQENKAYFSKREGRMRKQKWVWQLPNDIGQRFESAPLVWDGSSRFSDGTRTSQRRVRRKGFCLKEFPQALRRESRRLRARLGGVSRGEATALPPLWGGERRGAPARLPVVLAESEAVERREAWGNSFGRVPFKRSPEESGRDVGLLGALKPPSRGGRGRIFRRSLMSTAGGNNFLRRG